MRRDESIAENARAGIGPETESGTENQEPRTENRDSDAHERLATILHPLSTAVAGALAAVGATEEDVALLTGAARALAELQGD